MKIVKRRLLFVVLRRISNWQTTAGKSVGIKEGMMHLVVIVIITSAREILLSRLSHIR
jgi:hypothetical protein